MILLPLTLDRKPGMPPDGAKGHWLGFDGFGGVYIMWWGQKAGYWRAVGKSRDGDAPAEFILPAGARFIVAHAPVPSHSEAEG